MKKVTLKPVATLVAQVQAGTEVQAVVDNGILYLPVMDLGTVLDSSSTPTKETTTTTKPAPKKAPAKAVKETPKKDEKVYDSVLSILEAIDEGDLDEKQSLAELVSVTGFDEKFCSEHLNAFLDDSEADIDEMTKTIEAGPKVAKKKAPRGKAKIEEAVTEEEESSEKVVGEEVSVEELAIGDKVDVYWDEFEDTFSGEVVKITKGKPYVKYDEDGETEVVDTKAHTKITFLGTK